MRGVPLEGREHLRLMPKKLTTEELILLGNFAMTLKDLGLAQFHRNFDINIAINELEKRIAKRDARNNAQDSQKHPKYHQ
jgi:hypothetical protein